MSSFFLPQYPMDAAAAHANPRFNTHLFTLEELEYNLRPRSLDEINTPHFIPDNTPFHSSDEPRAIVSPPLQKRLNTPSPYLQYYFWNVSKKQSSRSPAVPSVRSGVDSLDEKQITVAFSGQEDIQDFRPRTLRDVSHRNLICSWAQKKHTSIKLQEFLPMASEQDMELVWDQIAPDAVNLSCDTFGNMFMQKFLAQASPNLRRKMAYSLTSHAAQMSQNEFGCWVIQKAIESLDDIGDIWMHVTCLSDEDLAKLILCKHGHYVIEKMLEKISDESVDRIQNVLYPRIREYAVHQCGYHVVLKIIERATPQFKNHLIEQVLNHCLSLAKDQFGNFIVKRVIEMNDGDINARIEQVVLDNLEMLSLNRFGSHVVEELLERLKFAQMGRFVETLLNRSDKRLVRFFKHQTGNYVVQKMIAGSARRGLKKLKKRLDRGGLKESLKHGRGSHVVEALNKKLRK